MHLKVDEEQQWRIAQGSKNQVDGYGPHVRNLSGLRLFYLVATGWIFDISLCEDLIKQISINQCQIRMTKFGGAMYSYRI